MGHRSAGPRLADRTLIGMSRRIEVRDAIRCGRRRDGVVDDVAMPVRVLDEQQAAELRATSLSYLRRPDQADQAPAGFARLRCTRTLSRRDFDEAAADLLSWRMHERAGLHVLASDIPLRIDTVVLMRWGPGPLSLRIPCRVVELVDEPRRRGFSYGTLTGHPETGEERFLLEQLDDGRVTLTITAISRPASTLARFGGPLTRAAQRLMTQRYLRALDLR
jgi:uncharacterized protein (UPF0548 family)